MRALRAIEGLHANGSVKGWLFTILRNIWLNQLRQRRTALDLIELHADDNRTYEPADAAQDPYSVYANRVEREQVRAAIQQLPQEFREVILLREYEELYYQEIAVLLDRPLGTVVSRLARARARLRELLTGGQITPGWNKRSSVGRIAQRHENEIGFEGRVIRWTINQRCREYFAASCSSLIPDERHYERNSKHSHQRA